MSGSPTAWYLSAWRWVLDYNNAFNVFCLRELTCSQCPTLVFICRPRHGSKVKTTNDTKLIVAPKPPMTHGRVSSSPQSGCRRSGGCMWFQSYLELSRTELQLDKGFSATSLESFSQSDENLVEAAAGSSPRRRSEDTAPVTGTA